MARIPMTRDVADLIGESAQLVENRSLLLDKFVFHKRWPDEVDGFNKWDDASRWSFTRLAEGASSALFREANDKRKKASGRNVQEANASRLEAEADLAESLAKISWDSKELSELRVRHTSRFLGLFQRAYGSKVSITVAELQGRLAINLADGLVQNAGICLDRLMGMPYIPGSAVKGVTRHAALQELRNAPESEQPSIFKRFQDVFGSSDSDFGDRGDLHQWKDCLQPDTQNKKGSVSFLPAYPLNHAKIVVDVTTVHYPDYYRTGESADLASEKPRPNCFPVVETGAQFAFCLALNGIENSPEVLVAAKAWLETALTVGGIGAKTASGYGWFALRHDLLQNALDQERQEVDKEQAKARSEADAAAKKLADEARLAAMPPEEKARETFASLSDEPFATAVSGVATLSVAEQKGLLMALLMPQRIEAWKRWKKSDKSANKLRVEALLTVATKHGIKLP